MIYLQEKDQIKTCGMCNNEIELNNNLNGLVVNDEHFICSNCCTTTHKLELTRHVKEKSDGSNNIRPIMRWLWESSNN